jgi:hypothetical protein
MKVDGTRRVQSPRAILAARTLGAIPPTALVLLGIVPASLTASPACRC